jgi:hypothetical protein
MSLLRDYRTVSSSKAPAALAIQDLDVCELDYYTLFFDYLKK